MTGFPSRSTRQFASGVLVAISLGACAPSAPVLELTPVSPTPTGDVHPGQIVWRDLVTDDLEAVQEFYGGLFGWTFADVQDDGRVYSVIRRNGQAIGGIVPVDDRDPAVSSARWLSLMSVPDVDATIADLRAAGGSVEVGPRTNPTRGRMALVRDPQGAQLVLVRAAGGDPPFRTESDIGSGDWLWTELWASDAGAASSFYVDLVGYSAERPQVDGAPSEYRVLRVGGRPHAGVNEIPWDDVQPNWLPYVRVDDPAAVARRAEELGGRVLIAPDPSVRQGSAALLMDPTGAAFAIQRWPVEGAESPGASGLGGAR
jgi:predicted enzyme related to lactoylglutathione lyase